MKNKRAWGKGRKRAGDEIRKTTREFASGAFRFPPKSSFPFFHYDYGQT